MGLINQKLEVACGVQETKKNHWKKPLLGQRRKTQINFLVIRLPSKPVSYFFTKLVNVPKRVTSLCTCRSTHLVTVCVFLFREHNIEQKVQIWKISKKVSTAFSGKLIKKYTNWKWKKSLRENTETHVRIYPVLTEPGKAPPFHHKMLNKSTAHLYLSRPRQTAKWDSKDYHLQKKGIYK